MLCVCACVMWSPTALSPRTLLPPSATCLCVCACCEVTQHTHTPIVTCRVICHEYPVHSEGRFLCRDCTLVKPRPSCSSRLIHALSIASLQAVLSSLTSLLCHYQASSGLSCKTVFSLAWQWKGYLRPSGGKWVLLSACVLEGEGSIVDD